MSASIGVEEFSRSHFVGVFDFHTNYVDCEVEKVSSVTKWVSKSESMELKKEIIVPIIK